MGRNVVVIGAGQAGMSLSTKLRALGHEGPITLIGDEPHPPYQRPPLSKKYLLGEMDRERLHLKAPSVYQEERITLVTGEAVMRIDRAKREVVTEKRRVPYDVAALTTGSRPRLLPDAMGGHLEGVYAVRGLDDIDRMANEFAQGRRVLIVGGGYIGLEAAAVAAMRNLEVTLIEMAPRILNRVAAPETADAIRALHQANGVDMREGVALERLEGAAGRVTEAILADGSRIAADFVIVGIGILPETRLAEEAGLAIENGILTDGLCRSSDPAIFAAGDCASFPYQGQRIRLESVQNAIDQAEHAAAVIHGATDQYLPVPWFWSDQYSAKLQIAGLNTGYDKVYRRAGARAGAESFWYFQGARFLAVDAISDPKAYMLGKRWLETGVSPDPANLTDPAVDLKSLR